MEHLLKKKNCKKSSTPQVDFVFTIEKKKLFFRKCWITWNWETFYNKNFQSWVKEYSSVIFYIWQRKGQKTISTLGSNYSNIFFRYSYSTLLYTLTAPYRPAKRGFFVAIKALDQTDLFKPLYVPLSMFQANIKMVQNATIALLL